jgi:hypothetical protein
MEHECKINLNPISGIHIVVEGVNEGRAQAVAVVLLVVAAKIQIRNVEDPI